MWTLRLRVGLNSGQVIAGEIGSGSLGYTAIGEQVGMAQRMESVAPPGGVMLSASTARLVDGAAALGEPELVQIKGADEPVMARRLFGMGARPRADGAAEPALVGRQWEMSAVESLLDRSIRAMAWWSVWRDRRASARAVWCARWPHWRAAAVRRCSRPSASRTPSGPVPCRGAAAARCRWHRDVDDETARQLVRAQVPDGSDEDVVLFNDLLGIGDPDTSLPTIDPDARRRRLTALINSLSLARTDPAST